MNPENIILITLHCRLISQYERRDVSDIIYLEFWRNSFIGIEIALCEFYKWEAFSKIGIIYSHNISKVVETALTSAPCLTQYVHESKIDIVFHNAQIYECALLCQNHKNSSLPVARAPKYIMLICTSRRYSQTVNATLYEIFLLWK